MSADVTLSHEEAQTYRIDVIADEIQEIAAKTCKDFGMRGRDAEFCARSIANQWSHDRDGYIEFATDGIR